MRTSLASVFYFTLAFAISHLSAQETTRIIYHLSVKKDNVVFHLDITRHKASDGSRIEDIYHVKLKENEEIRTSIADLVMWMSREYGEYWKPTEMKNDNETNLVHIRIPPSASSRAPEILQIPLSSLFKYELLSKPFAPSELSGTTLALSTYNTKSGWLTIHLEMHSLDRELLEECFAVLEDGPRKYVYAPFIFEDLIAQWKIKDYRSFEIINTEDVIRELHLFPAPYGGSSGIKQCLQAVINKDVVHRLRSHAFGSSSIRVKGDHTRRTSDPFVAPTGSPSIRVKKDHKSHTFDPLEAALPNCYNILLKTKMSTGSEIEICKSLIVFGLTKRFFRDIRYGRRLQFNLRPKHLLSTCRDLPAISDVEKFDDFVIVNDLGTSDCSEGFAVVGEHNHHRCNRDFLDSFEFQNEHVKVFKDVNQFFINHPLPCDAEHALTHPNVVILGRLIESILRNDENSFLQIFYEETDLRDVETPSKRSSFRSCRSANAFCRCSRSCRCRCSHSSII